MPIFISYSHQDKEFVDKLALQLINRNINIWLDRWELSVGDTILDKVQDALDGASALLVILSKASTSSEWCNKELSSGLLRELEEKRVVVLPVLLEDCTMPIFARGKMYADFRNNFDQGFTQIIESIAKIISPSLNRSIQDPECVTDWSIDHGDVNGQLAIILNYVQHPLKLPFTCLINIEILANEYATDIFHEIAKKKGIDFAKMNVIESLNAMFETKGELRQVLSSEKEEIYRCILDGNEPNENYNVRIGTRRVGEDTGRNILINTSAIVTETLKHMKDVLRKPKPKN